MKYTTKDGKVWDDLTAAETHEDKLFNDWISSENNEIVALLPKEIMPHTQHSYKISFMMCLRKVWDATPYENPYPLEDHEQYTTNGPLSYQKQDFEENFESRLISLGHSQLETNLIMKHLRLAIRQLQNYCLKKTVNDDYASLRNEISMSIKSNEHNHISLANGNELRCFVLNKFDQAVSKLETQNES